MIDDMHNRHEEALGLVRAMMLAGSDLGLPLSRWRDYSRKMIAEYGLPQPEDLIAWTSAGKATDANVDDWDQQYTMT